MVNTLLEDDRLCQFGFCYYITDKAKAKGNTYTGGCRCNGRLKVKTDGSTCLTRCCLLLIDTKVK